MWLLNLLLVPSCEDVADPQIRSVERDTEQDGCEWDGRDEACHKTEASHSLTI